MHEALKFHNSKFRMSEFLYLKLKTVKIGMDNQFFETKDFLNHIK